MSHKGERNNIDQNLDHALVLLVQEILAQLDEVAYFRSRGYSARISRTLLKETCAVLRELDPQQLKRYFEILVTLTANTKAPLPVSYSEEYAQLVVAAKQRFVLKIRNALKLNAA